jgi:hypothetical protein
MQKWSQEQKERVIEALAKREVRLPCPRCGSHNFTLLDGYFKQSIQAELGKTVLGGPAIPSVVTVCTQCGFISQHALGVLGLLPTEEENNE